MMMKRLLLVLCFLSCAGALLAETIAYTSFTEPDKILSRYKNTLTSPGYLTDQTYLEYVPGVGDSELGFRTYYNGYDGPTPAGDLADTGDYIGATDHYNATNPGSYQLEDCDPELSCEFDRVDISGATAVVVQAQVKILAAYDVKNTDFVELVAKTDVGDYTLFYVMGQDMKALWEDVGYAYQAFTAAIPDNATWVDVVFTVHSEDYQVGAQLDDLYIFGDTGTQPTTSSSFGWEGGEDVLGTFGNIVVANDSSETNSGTGSLFLERGVDSPPQAYIARIEGLDLGETVSVSVHGKTGVYSGDESGSIGISAFFTNSSNDYLGSAGLANEYSQGTDWTEINGTFGYVTSEATATGIMITARVWDESGDTGWLDDITITYPDRAGITVTFPSGSTTYPATTSSSYGWENQGTVLDAWNWPVASNVFTEYYSGSRSLKLTKEFGNNSTPQSYIAFIDNLKDGDVVRASMFAKTGRYTGSIPDGGAVRLWAHYTDEIGNLISFAGYAGGNETYSQDSWTELEGMWVFDEGDTSLYPARTGMIIEARNYSNGADVGYVDDITIEVPDKFAPDNVNVTFPDPCSMPVCTAPFTDFSGNCKTDMPDLELIAQQWPFDGYGPYVDGGYIYYGYDWSDDYATDFESLRFRQTPNDPNVILNSVDYLSGGHSLSLGWREATFETGEVVVAIVEDADGDMTEGNQGIVDGDPIYVAVTLKNLVEDPNVYLSIGGKHLRARSYAGGTFERDIESTTEWNTYSATLYFDIGDVTQYAPRDGLGITVFVHGYPGTVSGLVDRIVVAAPYRETPGGSPMAEVWFPPTGASQLTDNPGTFIDMNNPAAPYELPIVCVNPPSVDVDGDCKVTLTDYSILAFEWLQCGWSQAASCP